MITRIQRNQRSFFGKWLEEYCYEAGLFTPAAIHAYLEQKGFTYSQSAVYKYVTGKLTPSATFIYDLVQCLELDEEQERVLVEAVGYDLSAKFREEYKKHLKKQSSAATPELPTRRRSM